MFPNKKKAADEKIKLTFINNKNMRILNNYVI